MTSHNYSSQTMSIAEAADALGVSPSAAYRLAREGEFPVPVIKMGRTMKIARAQLAAYLGGPAIRSGQGDLTSRVERLEAENAHLRQVLGGIGALLARFDKEAP